MRQITFDGHANHRYTEHVQWAPDAQHVMIMRERPAQERLLTLINSAPPDQLQPKLTTHTYLKPGDEIKRLQPVLFTVGGTCINHATDLYDNPWSINQGTWLADSSAYRFLYNQRGHQCMRVVELGVNGKTRAVIEEITPTFFSYSSKLYCQHHTPSDHYLWMSERDGWNHLYRYDGATGQVLNQVTRGAWVVKKVLEVDWQAQLVYFYACGVLPDQDPYYQHYCVAHLDGSQMRILTAGDGTHEITLAPDKRYFVDTWSRVDLPYQFELRERATGRLITPLLRQTPPALDFPLPQRFVAKGRDGQTAIYGLFYRPVNFDPQKKYPVIEEIYAGPHDAFVPKAWQNAQSLRNQTLANLGCIVVRIDGMGTNWRSKKFHDVAWRNLADAGFPDRIAWMRALAQTHTFVDITRVGIYGGSAGGQSTLAALLFHGDFYKVGVADCGCHDNRMDKIWWNEQWMGWPVGPHYAEQSNVTQAHKLQGKLLLTVGECDSNVDPSSTIQVVDALIKADKDFELAILPGAEHGAGEIPWAVKKRARFLLQHLLTEGD